MQMNKKLALFGLFLLNFNVSANCNQAYKKGATIKAVTGPLLSTAMPAQGIAAIAISHIPSVGAFSGTFTPFTGQSLFGAHFLSMAIYPVLGAISSTTAYDRLKTYKLLEEVDAGIGTRISNLADDLSEELDRDISEKEILDILVPANQKKIFCQADQKLFSNRKIRKYLIDNLSR